VGYVPIAACESNLRLKAYREPWRRGRRDVDPREEMCPGELQWEPGTGWWLCQACGHIGCQPYHGHYQTLYPHRRPSGLLRLARKARALAAQVREYLP